MAKKTQQSTVPVDAKQQSINTTKEVGRDDLHTDTPVSVWENLYNDSWKDLITPESFSHPAKMARGLLARILKHAKEQGWLKPNDILLDVFGGVGTTGLLGAYESYQCMSLELEPRFVTLAKDNYALHAHKLKALGCPQPVILQGDSRELSRILQERFSNEEEQSNGSVCDVRDSGGAASERCDAAPQQDRPDILLESLPENRQSNDDFQSDEGESGVSDKRSEELSLSCGTRPKGGKEWELQARNDGRQIRLSQKEEKAMREVRNDGESGDTSQEQRPLRQSGRESANALQSLPHADNNAQSDRSPKSGDGVPEKQRPCKLESQVELIISSPPYAETVKGDGTQNETAAESKALRNTPGGSLGQSQRTQGYGSKGNLGNLKPGSVDAVVSSPPFCGVTSDKPSKNIVQSGLKMGASSMGDGYGASEGQLGAMKPGDVELILSSPPFEDSLMTKDKEFNAKARPGRTDQCSDYGKTEGNIGNSQGDTFWQAARTILEQCYMILKPQGHAIFVVKSFVRKGAIVDFPGDWRRLCESVGFETVCVHHAMLVKPGPPTFWDEPKLGRKHRRSFFKNLGETKEAWKNYWNTLSSETQQEWLDKAANDAKKQAFEASGEDEFDWNENVRIDFEVVICCQKGST